VKLLLEEFAETGLPVNAYSIQYTFKNGQTVDAIIHTAGGKVPVIQSFPWKNFARCWMQNRIKKENCSTVFRTDVKNILMLSLKIYCSG